MSNHTKGPWEINPGDTDTISANGIPVAFAARKHWGDMSTKNARLIAAAPELYEALEWCCKNMCPNCTDDFCKEICEIRKVLDKANGTTISK